MDINRKFLLSMILTGILGLIFLSHPTLAADKIYKWRDKNGKLHFSDKPPPEQQAKEAETIAVKDTTSPSEVARAKAEANRRLSLQRKRLASISDQAQQEALLKAKQENDQKKRQFTCAVAKQDLLTLKSRGVVTSIDKNGKQIYYTDDERNQLIGKYEDFIQKYCQ